jgi:uncharacterized membrane protein YdjX (TVP38/TMEM64 family)
LGILTAVLAVIIGVAWATGLIEHLEPEAIRARVQAAGPWGPLVILGVTVASNFLHVPALPFILLSQATWGAVLGSIYAWRAAPVEMLLKKTLYAGTAFFHMPGCRKL